VFASEVDLVVPGQTSRLYTGASAIIIGFDGTVVREASQLTSVCPSGLGVAGNPIAHSLSPAIHRRLC
jgi:hypothetical protein